MKNVLLKTFMFFVFLLTGGHIAANHIVGGELRMKSLGTERFEISLIQYWDEKSLIIPTPTVVGNRDPTAELYIYSKRNNALMDRVIATYQSTSQIEYQNKACATSRSLQTLTGIYNGVITLSSKKYNDPQGYYVIWERCCRNDDINNIVNPGDNGMVFYLEFPPISVVNSAPEFQLPNGQYICINRDFTMNMSAVDVDGDELKYSLVTPMRGNTSPDEPMGNDFRKDGYPLVTWENGVSLSNVISGALPLSIDNSGILKVNADHIGLYVFTIQCEEFRNGKKIGLTRRDFQLLVIDCNDDTPEKPVVMLENQPVLEATICPEKPVKLETVSSQNWSYQWQLNGLNIQGATNSSLMVSDTGSYTVIKSFSTKCSKDTSSSAVHITYKEIEAIISTSDQLLCEGQSAVLLANGGTLAGNLVCSWSLDNVALAEKKPRIEVSAPGLYQLVVTDSDLGCTGKDTITINQEVLSIALPEKGTVIEGSSIFLKPDVSPGGLSYSYQWSPLDGIVGDPSNATVSVSPKFPTQYTVSVNSANGCSARDSIMINVIEKMHIPSAFSPNNDGVNDTFLIFNAKDQIETIRIFNRWGTVIFQSVGYNQPWDGMYANKRVPAGSYPFIIETTERDYKGEIVVLE